MSLSKKTNFLFLFVAGLLVVGIITYRMIYRPHKPVEEQSVLFKGASEDLLTKISGNPAKWEGVFVEIVGKVTLKDKGGFLLNPNIYCQLVSPDLISEIEENQVIKIKGRFIGYDDLIDEFKLDNTIILK